MDLELLKKEYEEAKKKQGGGEYWFPKEGLSLIRILPPKNSKLFYKATGVHYRLLGSGMEICPKITFNTPCPICELIEKLYEMKIPKAAKMISDLGLKKRFLMNVIDLDSDPNKIMQFLAGIKIRLEIMAIILDPDYGNITHPQTGRNVVIERVTNPTNKLQTEYRARAKPNITEIDSKLVEATPDFDEYLAGKVKSYADLSALLLGEDEDELGSIDDVIGLYEEKANKKAQPITQGVAQMHKSEFQEKKAEVTSVTAEVKASEVVDPIQAKIQKLFKK